MQIPGPTVGWPASARHVYASQREPDELDAQDDASVAPCFLACLGWVVGCCWFELHTHTTTHQIRSSSHDAGVHTVGDDMDGRGSVSGLFGVHMKMWEMLGWALPLPCLPPLDVHLTQTSGVSMKMQEPDFAKARARQKKRNCQNLITRRRKSRDEIAY